MDPLTMESRECVALLSALLQEVRGMRRALERTRAVESSAAHCSLLGAIAQLVGNVEWTCDDLIEEARDGTSIEAAQLRAALKELGATEPRALGTYLRSRAGLVVDSLELRRHDLTRQKARRWSVVAV